ncbi:hypothetical protein ACFFGR_18075 [Arthrobacter liuii]|uniref:N-acetyltransferase domain-containing protein n=1 Tax=Arthrobacter liuii TaxID=1476996 RepID=A0ABQ2AWK1_9MICC|nr:hypothetical protein [Arthrobacter liuii]GGH97202.1 hypothetical protein GCM10007170_26860 [Arthrobacter liuii]
MPEQHNTPATGWIPAWADLQERSIDPINAGFVVEGGLGQAGGGREYVSAWPGRDAQELAARAADEPGVRLTLLCADAATDAPAPDGLAPVSERVLLMAPTAELNTGAELPENSQVALAPMETYDAVEITVFDHPVAKGRIQVRDDFAAVAITELPEGPDKEAFERGLFAAMAEEAFLHGAEYLHMVVEPDAAAPYEASGWAVAGRLLGFEKN